MIGLLFWAVLAQARDLRGHDEFGRACALNLDARVSVMVEDEWYDGHVTAGQRLLMTPVRARDGGQYGELELHFGRRGPAWFRLTLVSATGYAHACRLEP